MTISHNHHPDNEGVIDQILSAMYESEPWEYHANAYAFEVLHHYFGDFSDEWYRDWIATEEFRGQKYPDGNPMGLAALKRYEKMYDLYWDARAEFANLLISNLNRKNLMEATRNQMRHTLTETRTWDETRMSYIDTRVTHHMDEEF